MSDRKFSWYTIVHPDYEGWPAPPIYRLVGPAIEQSGETTCDIYYKPNRKGGHRKNHIINVARRALRNPGKWERVKDALLKDIMASYGKEKEHGTETWL